MQKYANLVDLVKIFPTSILLHNLVSIEPITSPITPRPEIQFSHTYHAQQERLELARAVSLSAVSAEREKEEE